MIHIRYYIIIYNTIIGIIMVESSIFRAYDIRGVYGKDFSDKDFEAIGNFFSGFVKHVILVGRDPRISSPALKSSLVTGLTKAGIDVMDSGLAPKGAVLLHGWKNHLPSLYITASHLPPEWNGLKFTYSDGSNMTEEQSKKAMEFVLSGKENKTETQGMVEQTPVLNEYRKFLRKSIDVMDKELRVLLDCGNGTAGISAPDAFNDHGCETSVMFQEPDGSFPNRSSEIKESTLVQAMKKAKDFDVTVAFDGDADRIALLDNTGRYVSPEMTAYLIASELLKHHKGNMVANMECSRLIDRMAADFGRKVVKIGRAHV
jgi:phosphomannomutase